MDHIVHDSGQRIRDSPIYKLPINVLWCIFSINTLNNADFVSEPSFDGERESSNITARHTSQVCGSWRRIMLSASSIWANTLNFEHLDQKKDDWRQEVLRRTGESSLSIIARGLRQDDPGNRFLVRLIETEAGRIRRIAASTPYHNVFANNLVWEILFSKRAPHLEAINITQPWLSQYDEISAPTDAGSSVHLFCDNAPRLHTLFLRGSTRRYIPAAWNSNIRHLQLCFTYLDPLFFDAVSAMHSLEFLSLIEISSIKQNAARRTISLPNLRQFNLSSHIEECTHLMKIFTPNRAQTWTSTISMEGYPRMHLTRATKHVPTLRRAIAAHMESQFHGEMLLVLSHETITIANKPYFCFPLPYPEGYFYIHIRDCPDSVQKLYIDELATAAGNSSTNRVFFDINRAPRPNIIDYAALNLLRSLINVTTIYTGTHGLMYLSRWLLDAGESFAHLRTLVINGRGGPHRPLSLSLITDIVKQRRDAGFPLSKVNLTRCDRVKKRVVSGLRREGLEVMWNGDIER